jgi:kinesin family protein 11
MDDVPTGITPKKKTWNVQQSWERTEPREALLEAFRRRKVDESEVGVESAPSSPEDVLPTVASIESIPSITSTNTSLPMPISAGQILANSQIRMKKPTALSKLEKLDGGLGLKEERDRDRDRVVVPLGETGGNIPVPRRRR